MRISDWSSDVCSSDLGRHQPAPAVVVVLGAHALEGHAGEPAAGVDEGLGHAEIEDRDAFVHRVLLLPRAGLHLVEARAHQHLDVATAEPARGAAAVHRGIAAAAHQHALADPSDVAEVDVGQPAAADRTEEHTSELQNLMPNTN